MGVAGGQSPVVSGVVTRHVPKHGVVEGLDSKAQAIHARIEEFGETTRVQVLGIRLESHLGSGSDGVARLEGRDDVADPGPRNEGRGTAPEVNRVRLATTTSENFRGQGSKIAVAPRILWPTRINGEVAVGALLRAERDVEVDAERTLGSRRDQRPLSKAPLWL